MQWLSSEIKLRVLIASGKIYSCLGRLPWVGDELIIEV